MNTEAEKTTNHELENATKSIPDFQLPLNDKQKKVDKLFNNNMLKALTLLKGKEFRPTTQIPSDSVEAVMEDLFKEDIEIITKEVKEGMRNLMKKKVEFDRVVKQKTLEFQANIIEQKSNLNTEFEKVMSKIQSIEQLKNNYLESFKAAQDSKQD